MIKSVSPSYPIESNIKDVRHLSCPYGGFLYSYIYTDLLLISNSWSILYGTKCSQKFRYWALLRKGVKGGDYLPSRSDTFNLLSFGLCFSLHSQLLLNFVIVPLYASAWYLIAATQAIHHPFLIIPCVQWDLSWALPCFSRITRLQWVLCEQLPCPFYDYVVISMHYLYKYTDYMSLCTILYHLVTIHRPFQKVFC